ncbi:MAG: chemotaxis protein CheB [Acidobacteriota bacterium]
MRPKLVAVGTSLGGFMALQTLLGGLPADFPLPVAVVQHRGQDSDDTFISMLQKKTRLRVEEAEDKAELAGGKVYLAPSDYHLLVEPGHIALSTEGPVISARPSIDVLFESAAEAYPGGVVGLLLTGASKDGAVGMLRIKESGGFTIVQDPATAECAVMPAAAIAMGAADKVLPLGEIASFLMELVRNKARP